MNVTISNNIRFCASFFQTDFDTRFNYVLQIVNDNKHLNNLKIPTTTVVTVQTVVCLG